MALSDIERQQDSNCEDELAKEVERLRREVAFYEAQLGPSDREDMEEAGSQPLNTIQCCVSE